MTNLIPIPWPDTPEERRRREETDALRAEVLDYLRRAGVEYGSPAWRYWMDPFIREYSLRDHAYIVEDSS